MTTEQLQGTIHAVPFVPFVLRLADGQRIAVNHPEFIMHPPGHRTFVVWREDQSFFQIVDLLLVVTVDVEVPQTAGSS